MSPLVFIIYSNPILDSHNCDNYFCEVFYAKQKLNVWKVIFAFFPKSETAVRCVYLFVLTMYMCQLLWVQEVDKIYWSCDTGPIIDVHFNKEIVKLFVTKQINGWICIINEHHQQVMHFVGNHNYYRYWSWLVCVLAGRILY